VAGILMLSNNPRYYLPGAYVQFLRISGTTLSERPDDQVEICGDLQSVLRELDARLKNNVRTELEEASVLRERLVPDFPPIAVRELLLNAIMHRDYQSNTPVRFYWFSDRIDIQSPGGLYGEVTADTLTETNSYRNPVIAECMKSLGYVNRFGYGIQRAQAVLKQNGNPPPEFRIDQRVFLATVRRRSQ
jgi:ATP-dependent DNA helicase RecG